jgi:hypothetical protein
LQQRKQVVVFGSSLNMAGIAASLKKDASLDIVCVDSHAPNARERLRDLLPAAIAFDLSDSSMNLDISLLQKKPGLLLIGVDPSSNEMLVLSSYLAQALSVKDLVEVIY